MNRTIKLLMFSDIFVLTGFGLIEPILAIYLKEDLIGGTIFAAGIASAIFLITKSLVQLPFSKYVDEHDDKVKWLILGTFLITLVPFIYIFAKEIYFIYLAQLIYGVGAGIAYPTWLGLWSTHLDKKHESFEWSVYSTMAGLGTALTAAAGAAIAEFISFTATFIIVGLMSLIGCIILIFLYKKEKEEEAEITTYNYYKHRKSRPQEK